MHTHSSRYGVLIPVLMSLSFACVAAQEEGYPRNQALYVTMRDGVKIAVDVWLPENLEHGDRLPTIMRATRYWRAVDMVDTRLEKDRNFDEAQHFNGDGYALVIVDGRGSGASFGTRPYELSEDETADYGEIVDWIIDQPWSNQRVGAYGVSYAGNTTEMLVVNRHPAVKAVAPLFNDFDNFGHLIFPGGLLTVGFLEDWGDSVHHMDRNDACAVARVTGSECEALKKERRGVKPVDADEDGSLLAAAVREHQENVHPFEAALQYEYRDDPWGEGGVRGVGYKRSPAGHLPDIEASGVPMLIRVGWQDAATVNGALGRYMTISNPQQVFIGPWDHGARNNADPFLPPDTPVEPSREEQNGRLLEFFDTFLKDTGSGSMDSAIHYYTLGAGEWKTTKVWPPKGFETERWYFGADGLLGKEPPQSDTGADRYAVDFEATTGRHNRWYTNGGAGDVVYPDRSEEDKKLLTYTSAPMKQDVTITGHPLVTLYVASTATDGAFIVYLEDVAADGRVTYITEGELRGVMRRVTEEPPPYKKLGPHRSELRADALPLVPGEVAELTFELWATSVLIEQGHCIRVAVAGADKDTFLRYPKSGEQPVLSIERSRHHASSIQLPVYSKR
jgi:putative CocE/NonD family hydrolase